MSNPPPPTLRSTCLTPTGTAFTNFISKMWNQISCSLIIRWEASLPFPPSHIVSPNQSRGLGTEVLGCLDRKPPAQQGAVSPPASSGTRGVRALRGLAGRGLGRRGGPGAGRTRCWLSGVPGAESAGVCWVLPPSKLPTDLQNAKI